MRAQPRSKTFSNVLLALPLLLPVAASATEGALGRPISGTGVSANIGIVPPEPAWIINLNQVHYDGSLSGSKPAPISGEIGAGIDAKLEFTMATVMKVWDTGPGRWNFASAFTLPYLSADVDSQFSVGRFSQDQEQKKTGLYDLYFTPLI
ncbi:MAG: transporter, partial [Pseudomonas sp.]